ncbi:hypothetical protein K443DRAFT_111611, partial [Laccaria amethystina LaAM-08-1]
SFLCGFKGQKRQEARVAAFQRYFAFSVWWTGSLGKDKRDERCALSRSRDIVHFLFGGHNRTAVAVFDGPGNFRSSAVLTRGARFRVPEIFCIFWFGR